VSIYDRGYSQELRAWIQRVEQHAAYLATCQLERRDCPGCGSAEHEHFANNGHLDYARCKRCSLVFMNPTLSRAAVDQGFKGDDDLVMGYFSIVTRYRRPPQGRPDPATDPKLRDVYAIKKSGRLLDVGCSFGDFLHKARYFYEVEGVEVNPQACEVAARDFVIHRGYLHELGLKQRYDVVTLHQILYGVRDPGGLLRDIRPLLADDGILYVNTPNADSYAMQLYGGKSNHLYGYTTLNVFSRRSLEMLAAATGFRLRTFRTEWLDVYLSDLVLFLDDPVQFIHKRNSRVDGYEERIRVEDDCQSRLDLPLGDRGNYLVAVLEKA
jgi:SAM-dependent methyltransferase